jgi:four helix bundle protein
VWQKAMDLTDMAFEFCKGIPVNERYNLIDQINKCSFPSNIAEGSGKIQINTLRNLSIAISSSFELETQLLICECRAYGSPEKLKEYLELVIEIQKMTFNFQGIYFKR